jgi:hypothetical protein
MLLTVERELVFEPEYKGNRDLPTDRRIRVVYRYLTAGEERKYRYFEPVEYDLDTGKQVNRRRKYIEDRAGIVRSVVIKIDNLSLKVGDQVVKIDNGNKLYDYPVPPELVLEIESYILAHCDPEVDVDPTR